MGACRIIPLRGLGEVGKNMTVYEADGAIVVVDAGLAFPRDEHLGVDLVLPDFGYLRELEKMVRDLRPQAQIELETTLGAVIGAHAGPGTVGLFWFTDDA